MMPEPIKHVSTYFEDACGECDVLPIAMGREALTDRFVCLFQYQNSILGFVINVNEAKQLWDKNLFRAALVERIMKAMP